MEQLSSRVVYQNRWMTVREDLIRRPDGSAGIYGVVDKPAFSIIAAHERGGLWLVEQYRYTVGGRFWESLRALFRIGARVRPRTSRERSWPRSAVWPLPG
jgi:hypothetical protein